MVRQRYSAAAAATTRASAIQRHRRAARPAIDSNRPSGPPAGLVAKPAVPKSKHKTILEWTENADKKKKLEIEVTTNTRPNANFSFVPIGHPELTSLCKELSREQGALVYIVSTTKELGAGLSDHVHRLGYHFRTHIVDQAMSMVDKLPPLNLNLNSNPRRHTRDNPDPIPETQDEINKQADAAIRDLYPRIPNTDREMIIRHAFQKGAVFNGKPVVGLQADLTLSRRVQLAVVAHIRHTHTRYDLLLRQTLWETARRTVEPLCLDILVKWRGDEETGRDQLDEILREIVVIDDSDDDADEDADEDDDDESGSEEGEIEEDDGLEVIMEDSLATSNPDQDPEFNAAAPAEIGTVISNKPSSRGPSPAKALIDTQSTMLESRTGVQRPKPVKRSGKSPGISTRTRSKVGQYQPSSRQKAKKSRRGRKRYQAWQDALNRRNQRRTGPGSPSEHAPENTIIEINSSPITMQGKLALELDGLVADYKAPPNLDYQSIYAIDGSRGPSRLKTRLASPRGVRLSERPHKDQAVVISNNRDLDRWERSYDYNQSHPSSRIGSYGQSRPQTTTLDGRREIVTKDMALPSIERPAETLTESPGRVVSYGTSPYSQVRYQEADDGRQPPPAGSNSGYVDGWEEESKAKRRRLVVANDPSLLPIPMSNRDNYYRLIPVSKVEHPPLIASSSRRAADNSDARGQVDMVSMNKSRLDHSGYLRHSVNSSDRDNITYMAESRDYVSGERNRPFIIDDDSSPVVRVVRRPYRPNETYSSGQNASEPEIYKIHRDGNEEYYRPRNPTLSMPTSHQEGVRPIDPNQLAMPALLTRAPPIYQQRVATEMSSHNSSFPSHSRSREINSGQIFHQFPTSPDDPVSRFSSSRHRPTMIDSMSSQPLPNGRHSVDNFSTIRIQNGEESHRSPRFGEVSQMGPRYISLDSQSRALRAEPEYIPVDAHGRAIRDVRQVPASVSEVGPLMPRRSMPYREEVIVLSD